MHGRAARAARARARRACAQRGSRRAGAPRRGSRSDLDRARRIVRRPGAALGGEGAFAPPREGCDLPLVGAHEALVLEQREVRRLAARSPRAGVAVAAQRLELLLLDELEAKLIEMAQAPRRILPVVPDGDGTADELVAARALDPVNAQERAADAHGVRGRPRPRRVVLG